MVNKNAKESEKSEKSDKNDKQKLIKPFSRLVAKSDLLG